jgi:hypothetical protein
VVHLVMFWGKYKFGEAAEDPITLTTAYEEAWKIKEDKTLAGLDGKTVSLEKGSYIDQEVYLQLTNAGINMDNEKVKAISMTEVVAFSFSQWYIVLFYVIAMVLIAFHLSHGFQSAFRSLGLVHGKYTPLITKLGTAIAVVVPLIFAVIPVYYFFAN